MLITRVQIMTDDGMIVAIVDQERKISMAHQNMRKIPITITETYGNWIEVLDLSNNKLRDLSPLCFMDNLHTLVLDHNLVVSTSSLPSLPSLRTLSLNFNLISDLTLFVPRLGRSCPQLLHLSLMGNAVSANDITGQTEACQQDYRLYVLRHFGYLRHLDDKPVTKLERIQSCKNKEKPMDSVVNYLNGIMTSLTVKMSGNNNSIV